MPYRCQVLSNGYIAYRYTFEVGPTFTLIEDALIKKCLELFGFNEGDGILSPGGSISNMYAMVAARFRAIPDVKRTGLSNQIALVAFTSEDVSFELKIVLAHLKHVFPLIRLITVLRKQCTGWALALIIWC